MSLPCYLRLAQLRNCGGTACVSCRHGDLAFRHATIFRDIKHYLGRFSTVVCQRRLKSRDREVDMITDQLRTCQGKSQWIRIVQTPGESRHQRLQKHCGIQRLPEEVYQYILCLPVDNTIVFSVSSKSMSEGVGPRIVYNVEDHHIPRILR